MAKTNWQDPKTSEIRSTHVSGLQEAVGKIEDSISMQTVAGTDIALSEVYISSGDRYRIYQAPEGKRNWVSTPIPVVKKNGSIIASGFEIDYGGGAIIFGSPILDTDTVTVDATYTVVSAIATSASDISYNKTASGLDADDVQEAIDELAGEKLDLSGGTMTGGLVATDITVTGTIEVPDPEEEDSATPKKYVDSEIAKLSPISTAISLALLAGSWSNGEQTLAVSGWTPATSKGVIGFGSASAEQVDAFAKGKVIVTEQTDQIKFEATGEVPSVNVNLILLEVR